MKTTRARRTKNNPNRGRFRIGYWSAALILSLSGLSGVPFAHAAVNAEQRCQQAKLIASGKMSLCLKQQLSRKVAGKSAHPALCAAKFSAAITKADLRAARSGNSCRWLVNEDSTEVDLDARPDESASNTIIIFDGIASDLYNIDLCVEGADPGVAQSNVVIIFDGAEGDTYNISTCG